MDACTFPWLLFRWVLSSRANWFWVCPVISIVNSTMDPPHDAPISSTQSREERWARLKAGLFPAETPICTTLGSKCSLAQPDNAVEIEPSDATKSKDPHK